MITVSVKTTTGCPPSCKLVHSRNTGGEPELIIIMTIATLPAVSHKTAVQFGSQSVVSESVTQAHWQVAGQLYLHCQCLSKLNPFVPSVYEFVYLSSRLIILTAEDQSYCSIRL